MEAQASGDLEPLAPRGPEVAVALAAVTGWP